MVAAGHQNGKMEFELSDGLSIGEPCICTPHESVFRSGNRLIVHVWFYLRLIHSVAIGRINELKHACVCVSAESSKNKM